MNKERILSSFAENDYTSDVFSCNGRNNKCTIKSYKFSNGNEYYTGNNCEKIYSNKSESTYTGENIFAIKNALLPRVSDFFGLPPEFAQRFERFFDL